MCCEIAHALAVQITVSLAKTNRAMRPVTGPKDCDRIWCLTSTETGPKKRSVCFESQRAGAVWKSRWPSSVLIVLRVCVDVKQYWTWPWGSQRCSTVTNIKGLRDSKCGHYRFSLLCTLLVTSLLASSSKYVHNWSTTIWPILMFGGVVTTKVLNTE